MAEQMDQTNIVFGTGVCMRFVKGTAVVHHSKQYFVLFCTVDFTVSIVEFEYENVDE
jgi:hypothetical protein